MAQTVHLPVSFEFRTVEAQWAEVEGRVIGLGGDVSGNWEFLTQVRLKGRTKKVSLRQEHIPPRLLEQWIAKTNTLHEFDNFEDAAQQVFANFRPKLLVDFAREDRDERSLPADAWQLRDAFLRVSSDIQSALAFLNRWGCWTFWSCTRLDTLLAFQKTVRRALISSPEDWFEKESFSGLRLIERTGEYPYSRVSTVECEPAIRATVAIDLLRKAKFGICARRDCKQPFAITSHHRRKYCSQYCGHLESVRRSRNASLG